MGFFEDLANAIEEILEDVFDAVEDLVDEIVKEARRLLGEIRDWLKQTVRTVIGQVQNLIEKITSFASGFIARLERDGLKGGIIFIFAHVVAFFSRDRLEAEAEAVFGKSLVGLSDSQAGQFLRSLGSKSVSATRREATPLSQAEQQQVGDGYLIHRRD
jgi:hypothetical protein